MNTLPPRLDDLRRAIDEIDDGLLELLRRRFDVVAGKNQHIVRLFVVEEEQILMHRIGGALIPFFADPLLWWNRGDVFAEFGIQDVPACANVPIERVGFVLDQDGDFAKPGVETVAEREIDNAILSTKGHRRLGAMFGERLKPFAFSSRQHHGENVLHCGEL